MSNYVEIQGRPNLVREIGSHAVLNTDTSALEIAKQKRQSAMQMRQELDDVKQDVRDMKSMLSEILHHLRDDGK